MLLESALADFSTDESDVFEDAQAGVGFEWESGASQSNSPLKGGGDGGSNFDAAIGRAEVKHVYLDVKVLPLSRPTSSDLSTTPNHSRPLSDFLGMSSRSPPAADANCGPSFDNSRADDTVMRAPTGKGAAIAGRLNKSLSNNSRRDKNINSGADESLLHERMPFKGDAGAVPFAWEAQPGKPKLQKRGGASAPTTTSTATTTHQVNQLQPPPATRVISMVKNGNGFSPSSAPSQKKNYRREPLQQGRISSSPEGRVSSSPPGRVSPSSHSRISSSPQSRISSSSHNNRLSSSPQSRLSSSPQRRISSSPQGKAWASPRSRVSSSPKPVGVSPIRQPPSKMVRPPENVKQQIKRPHSFKTAPAAAAVAVHKKLDKIHSRSAVERTDNPMNSEYKYYEEESPVSILERPPSPPTATNSSGSSGSSVHTPPPRAASASTPVPPLPGVPISRRRLPSFSSSSAQDSPRASTSSSNRYMGQCLVALQAALAIDPEKLKRFEDSFVELDTYVEGDESQTFAKSPIQDHGLVAAHNNVRRSPRWARSGEARGGGGATAVASQLEPEYNAVDFYSDSEEENDTQSHIRSSSTSSSLGRSSSDSSVARPIRRALNYRPQVSVDEYSVKDKRFLSSHPSSWVDHGDDSISSSLTNSKSNTLTRHQDVPWDEQQADLDSVRAEEVVRGAIDGLRFTYSPVSSAFVFTRSSNEGDDETASARRGHGSYRTHTHKIFTDSEASRRFSVDYEASIYSEDSMSFARGSDVTELGVSRAESWSKVARGIAFHQQQQQQQQQQHYHQHQQQQGYQDAVPSSFVQRAGYAPMFEDGNHGGSGSSAKHSPDYNLSLGQPDYATADSRLVRKRPAKKSAMTTCLPFRSILKNFRTISSPGRSRLGMAPKNNGGDRPWTSPGPAPTVSRLTY